MRRVIQTKQRMDKELSMPDDMVTPIIGGTIALIIALLIWGATGDIMITGIIATFIGAAAYLVYFAVNMRRV
jgi:hypothetical protein